MKQRMVQIMVILFAMLSAFQCLIPVKASESFEENVIIIETEDDLLQSCIFSIIIYIE